MKPSPELDAAQLLARIARQIPLHLRGNVVVVGSIATAWQFRGVSGTASVATKDIDLLLRPSVEAVATAESLGQDMLKSGWKPHFPAGRQPGTPEMPEDQLPVLRLTPPRGGSWFVELMGEPLPDQVEHRQWRRFRAGSADFALPSFRYMRVAVHGADETESGLRVARPARMALAHLLEHATPDRTPISGVPGNPPRYVKDVGRAVALWWLAEEDATGAEGEWIGEWIETLDALYPGRRAEMKAQAHRGIMSVTADLPLARDIALTGVLAPHQTTLDAWRRSHRRLQELLDYSWEAEQ